jgi:hypothetical protein
LNQKISLKVSKIVDFVSRFVLLIDSNLKFVLSIIVTNLDAKSTTSEDLNQQSPLYLPTSLLGFSLVARLASFILAPSLGRRRFSPSCDNGEGKTRSARQVRDLKSCFAALFLSLTLNYVCNCIRLFDIFADCMSAAQSSDTRGEFS